MKETPTLSFLYRYQTQDITKNFSIEDGILEIDKLLGHDFLSGNLFTQKEDVEILYNKKRKSVLRVKKASLTQQENTQHNREKKRLISAENNVYLKRLGIVSSNDEVYKNKQDKFLKEFGNGFFTYMIDEWIYTSDYCNELLINQFNTSSLKGFGISNLKDGVIAAGVALHYLHETKHHQTKHIIFQMYQQVVHG